MSKAAASPRFVVGVADYLFTPSKPLGRSSLSKGHYEFPGTCRALAVDGDGFLAEPIIFKKKMFVRELPDDVLPSLAVLDAEIEKVLANARRLNRKRQAMLLDAAERGARVKAPKRRE